MTIRKMAAPLIALFVLSFTAVGFAQQLKVGVVNSQNAFNTSLEGKKAQGQLQDKDNKIKADLAKLDNEIKQLQTKISTQQMTLTNEAAVQIQSDIDKKTTARKRLEEDATRDMQQIQYALIQRIRGEMVGIIEAIAKEKGYDLVLDLGASGIVFFNPTIDITDEVIKRYDAIKAAAPKK
jgi:Skp family chaperone for outer membrane proteins